MNNRFNGKTLVITGANGIIGMQVCKSALLQGARVSAWDVSFSNLEALRNSLSEDENDRLFLNTCDLREKGDIQKAMKVTLDKWKTIDGLHNNAAWKTLDLKCFFMPFESYDLGTWHEVLSVNLDGVMLVDQVIGGHMAINQKAGSIVHTASIYGILGPDPKIYEGSHYLGGSINTPAVYSVSKGALISLTNYLSTYWGDKGVRVNCITPGGVESGQNETFLHKYNAKVPLGRMAEANEIADGVLFLLSNEASYITGHNLVVDGGFSKW